MAKYEVTHACGHTWAKELFGPEKERHKKLAWFEQNLCYDCYTEELTERAKEEADALELPFISGSEAQTAWAMRLRAELLADWRNICKEVQARLDAGHSLKNRPGESFTLQDADEAAIEAIKTRKDARWWIENRSSLRLALSPIYRQKLYAAQGLPVPARYEQTTADFDL